MLSEVRDQVDRLEEALVHAVRAAGFDAFSDGGTWRLHVRNRNGHLVEAINLSEMARDMERRLSC